jgi:hypothetical protein
VTSVATPAQLLASVCALDTIVYKAASPYDLILRHEGRLEGVLAKTFNRRAIRGVGAAVETLASGASVVSHDELHSALKTLAEQFHGWSEEVAPLVRVVMGEVYKIGRNIGADQFTGRLLPAAVLVEKAEKLISIAYKDPDGNWKDLKLSALTPEQMWELAHEKKVLNAGNLKAIEGWASANGKSDILDALYGEKPKKSPAAAPTTTPIPSEPKHAKDKTFWFNIDGKQKGVKPAKVNPDDLAALLPKISDKGQKLLKEWVSEHGGPLATVLGVKPPMATSSVIAPPTPPPSAPPAATPPKPGEPPKAMEIHPKFDLVDKGAVEALAKHQVYWLGYHYDKNLSDRVAAIAQKVMIEDGLPRSEAAKKLQEELTKFFGYKESDPYSKEKKTGQLGIPIGWKGNPQDYFGAVVANAATTARVAGTLKTYTELDITHYTVVNGLDERTCPICTDMNGRTFDVQAAAKQVQLTVAADNSEKVRTISPWLTEKEHEKLTEEKKDAATNAKLSKAGFSYPPFHLKCRCFLDIAAETQFIPTPLEPEKPKEGEFPWKSSDLTKVDKKLAGMHTKVVFKDPNGDEWIFKPQDEFRALGDLTAAKLAKAVGQDTADVFAYSHNGQFGSIQKVFKGVTGDLSGLPGSGLSEKQALAIQKEHIFDWFISQHDTHEQNVLRTNDPDKELRFIDKGQLFRFFGKDRFTPDYGQPGEPNPSGTYYHKMFSEYMSGKDVKLAKVKDLEPLIKNIEKLSDAEFTKLVKPYAKAASDWAAKNPHAKSATWMGRYSEDAFIKAALDRKNAIRGDVAKFYEQLEAQRAKNMPKPAAQLGPVSPAGATWKEHIAEAKKAGWLGRSFFVKGSDYEGANWLMYGTEGNGTFLDAKLRAAADRKLTALIGMKAEKLPANVHESLNIELHNTALKLTKSFNAHMKVGADQVIPTHTAQGAKDFHDQLSKIYDDKTATPGAKELAKHYLQHLEHIWDPDDKEFKKSGLGKMLDKAVTPPEPVEPKKKGGLPEGWSVSRVNVADTIQRKIEAGKIRAVSPTPTPQFIDQGGQVYKLTAPDGTTVLYRPHNSDVLMAARGQIRVHIPEDIQKLGPDAVAKAFSQLKALGLETEHATAKDLEAVYLRKVAHKFVLPHEQIPETLDTEEQAKKLRDLLTKHNIEAPHKPVISYPHSGGVEGQGWARWDYHKEIVPNEDKLTLTHDLSGDLVTNLKNILGGKTNALVANVEKFRIGIPFGEGMSPQRDMETGGASYVFLRIKEKGIMAGTFQFRPRILRDLDSISYNFDNYGRVDNANLKKRHAPREYDEVKNRSANETIFKHAVALDNLEVIRARSEAERKAAIKVFHDHGYKEFAGKKIEDLIITTGY